MTFSNKGYVFPESTGVKTITLYIIINKCSACTYTMKVKYFGAYP